MSLTLSQKQDIGEMLSIIFEDDSFVYYANKINDKTAQRAEEIMDMLIFCNTASTALFKSISCIPKSKNIYGWLISCVSAVVDVLKAHRNTLQGNMLCLNAIRAAHHSELLMTLL